MPQNPMSNLSAKIPNIRRVESSDHESSTSKDSSSKPSKSSSSSNNSSSSNKQSNQGGRSIRLGRIGRPHTKPSNSSSSSHRSSSHSSGHSSGHKSSTSGRSSSHHSSTGHSSSNHSSSSSSNEGPDEQSKTSMIIHNTCCSSLNVFFGGCLLYLVSNNYLTSIEQVFSFILIGISLIDFLLLLLRILRAKRLWRVVIKTYIIKEWIPISLVSGTLIHSKYHPITSLLELASLKGTTISRTMLVNGYIFWIICLLFILIKTILLNNDNDKEEFLMRIDTIFIFSSSMALCNVGAWQLNPWSLIHRWMHRIASLSCIVSTIAFSLQQIRQTRLNDNDDNQFNGLIHPQVMALCGSLCATFGVWIFFLIRARYYAKKLISSKEEENELADSNKKRIKLIGKNKDDEIKLSEEEKIQIHRHSIRCIISQSLMVLVGKCGVVMWVWYESKE